MKYELICNTNGGTSFIRKYKDGRKEHYDANDNLTKIEYTNGALKEYHDNGNLRFRIFPNGKCERYNYNKKLIYRKHNNCEEIWTYNRDGKCIEYTKHVYFN